MKRIGNNSVLLLVASMRDDYIKQIVKDVLSHRNYLSKDAQQQLSIALRDVKGIKGGFSKTPASALINQLMEPTIKLFHSSEKLVKAVLKAWVEIKSDIHRLLAEFLSVKNIATENLCEGKGELIGGLTEEMFQLIEEFVKKHQQFNEDDIHLMFCCLTNRSHMKEESSIAQSDNYKENYKINSRESKNSIEAKLEEKNMVTSLEKNDAKISLELLIKSFQNLPFDSLIWEDFPSFIHTLQKLYEDKQKERVKEKEKCKKLENFQDVLYRLVTDCNEELSFFGWHDCNAWTAKNLPVEEIQKLIEGIENLKEEITQHSKLRYYHPKTRSEQKEHNKKMEIAAARAEHIYQAILVTIQENRDEPLSEISVEALTQTRSEISNLTNGQQINDNSALENEETQTRELVCLQGISIIPNNLLVEEQNSEVEEVSSVVSEVPSMSQVFVDDSFIGMSSELSDMGNGEVSVSVEINRVNGVGAIENDENSEIISWEETLWKLIAKDELPVAYWLAHALQSNISGEIVPSWLLKAIIGSRWLIPGSYTFIDDILGITRSNQPSNNSAEELLGLSASLRACLIAPNSGMIGWLKRVTFCPELNPLIDSIKDFANGGVAYIGEILTEEQYQVELQIVLKKIQNWISDAEKYQAKNKGATDVWRYLISKGKGEVRELLDLTLENQHISVDHIKSGIKQLRDTNYYLPRRINEIHLDTVKGRKVDPLDGTARNQIFQYVKKACDLMNDWSDLQDRLTNQRKKDWLHSQEIKLREEINKSLPAVYKVISKLTQPSNSIAIVAATKCLGYSLFQLVKTLNISQSYFHFERVPFEEYKWLSQDEGNLEKALRRWLLLLPELGLDDEGALLPQEPLQIAKAIHKVSSEKRTIEISCNLWIEKKDFRFLDLMVRLEGENTHILTSYKTGIESARNNLRDYISQTLDAIEQAVVDGIIYEERTKYQAEIEAINVDEVLNISFSMNRLDNIQNELLYAREHRLSDLLTKWQDLKSSLNELKDKHKFDKVADIIQKAFTNKDVRVIDEYLSHLTNWSKTGDFDEELFTIKNTRDVLKDFLLLVPSINSLLKEKNIIYSLPELIKKGDTIAGINFKQLADARREETITGMEAWCELKDKSKDSEKLAHLLSKISHFLGFTTKASNAIKIKERNADWLYAQASLSASDLAKPIPQFGSQSRESYNLVCLWGEPGADTIGAILHQLSLDNVPVLIFYLSPLSENQRIELARLTRERDLALVILDETLMFFLTGENDARLRNFLKCALPFAAINPYTPEDVPQEMFFGRERMAKDLQHLSRSCLVYGGRQLGKSALLNYVKEQFHKPDNERFAVVIDIQKVGDPQSGLSTEELWQKLRESFCQMGWFNLTTEKSDKIKQAIKQKLLRSPNYVVLAMFDEADNFLDADAEANFRVVKELSTLMVETNRRFKAIFAGLQNVQRFQGIPNHPLVKFGSSILVGPLEPKDAQDLVKEPFEALGYRFTDKASIWRILSYTNYHAGLLQRFCQELLTMLHKKTIDSLPPYLIERADVEMVYRNRDVREKIRERFELTLALNTRYQAIAWSMIEAQLSVRDSFAKPYSVTEILKLVTTWWPEGFSNLGTDQVCGLLNEMCGLGVLLREPDARYRLRSPNLVRLMRTTEVDIENRLLELSQKPPEVKFIIADSHHAPLDDKATKYSPLTYEQERLFNQSKFGVCFIFSSNASGLKNITDAVQKIASNSSSEEPQNNFKLIPAEIKNGDEMQKWLRDFLQTEKKNERKSGRLIAIYQLSNITENPKILINASLRFCWQHNRAQEQWLRILFVFNPKMTWKWLLLPPKERQKIEEQVDLITHTRRWNTHGIKQRLAGSNKLHLDNICQKTLQITGGWPWLLDVLFDKSKKTDDVRRGLDEIEKELALPNSTLTADFITAIGIEKDTIAWKILNFIYIIEEVPEDFSDLELLEDPSLSLEQYRAGVEFLLCMNVIVKNKGSFSIEPTICRIMFT